MLGVRRGGDPGIRIKVRTSNRRAHPRDEAGVTTQKINPRKQQAGRGIARRSSETNENIAQPMGDYLSMTYIMKEMRGRGGSHLRRG